MQMEQPLGRLTVHENGSEFRIFFEEFRDPVGGDVGDRAVAGPHPSARGDHVPEGDPICFEQADLFGVRKRPVTQTEQLLDDRPEMVAGETVILPAAKRLRARHRAEDQHAGSPVNDRLKAAKLF